MRMTDENMVMKGNELGLGWLAKSRWWAVSPLARIKLDALLLALLA